MCCIQVRSWATTHSRGRSGTRPISYVSSSPPAGWLPPAGFPIYQNPGAAPPGWLWDAIRSATDPTAAHPAVPPSRPSRRLSPTQEQPEHVRPERGGSSLPGKSLPDQARFGLCLPDVQHVPAPIVQSAESVLWRGIPRVKPEHLPRPTGSDPDRPRPRGPAADECVEAHAGGRRLRGIHAETAQASPIPAGAGRVERGRATAPQIEGRGEPTVERHRDSVPNRAGEVVSGAGVANAL
jgi:hypothetical protein